MNFLTISKIGNETKQHSGNFLKEKLPEHRVAEIFKELNCTTIRLSIVYEGNQWKIQDVYQNPFKVLLITSYGTVTGEPLRMNVPNKGLIYLYDKFNSFIDFDCMYLDPNLIGKEGIYDFIKKQYFDIIGFSILNSTLHNDIELISNVRVLSPASKIVVGGLTIDTFKTDVIDYIPIDKIIKGDGFMGIIELLLPNSEISSYNFFEPESSSVNLFYDVKQVDFVNIRKYKESISLKYLPYNCVGNKPLRIRMSESCNGACTYCNVPKRKNLRKSTDEIIELLRLNQKSFDSVEFEDHEFTFEPFQTEEVCQKIIKNDLSGIPKQCCTRVDSISAELLQLMKESGFQIINYGIESFDQKILDFFRKGISVKDNIDVLDQTLSLGIKAGINLILFSPYETKETLINTIRIVTDFVQKGAAVNAVLKVTVSYGDKANRIASHIPYLEYENYFFEGMKQKWKLPRCLKMNENLESIYLNTLNESKAFSEWFRSEFNRHPSVALNSLHYLKSIAAYLEMNEVEILSKIIDSTIEAENVKEIWIKPS